jgi:hypothetical protein
MLLTAVLGVMVGIGNTGSASNPMKSFFTAHGGRANKGRMMIDGLNVAASFNGGGVSTFTYDTANVEEMQVLVSGGLGEAKMEGLRSTCFPSRAATPSADRRSTKRRAIGRRETILTTICTASDLPGQAR